MEYTQYEIKNGGNMFISRETDHKMIIPQNYSLVEVGKILSIDRNRFKHNLIVKRGLIIFYYKEKRKRLKKLISGNNIYDDYLLIYNKKQQHGSVENWLRFEKYIDDDGWK